MPSSAQRRLKIAVIGIGSIGGGVAGYLRHADHHDVTVCVRQPIGRLVVERPDGIVEDPIRSLMDPADAEPVDWVLLCTKTYDTASAAPWLARLCRPSTRVAVLQNGIDHAARVAPLAGGAAIVPTIVYFNSERIAPDYVRLRHVNAYDLAVPDDQHGRAFAELVEGTPLRVHLSTDFVTLIWRKLLLNAAANPISALTRQRQVVFRRDDVRRLSFSVLEEAVAVGRADGARLAADEAEQSLATLLSYPAETGTSMYFDCITGRPLEIDALTGAIVAAGERHGIPTPLNRTLLTLLRAVSDAAAASRQVGH